MTVNDRQEKTRTIRKVSGRLFEGFFLPWTAVLILSHLVTMYVGPAYMWGVHFYHFFPAWIGWMFTSAGLILLVPRVSDVLCAKLEAFAERIKRPVVHLNQNKTFLILSLLFLPVFWIFRTRLHLLGDGMFRITDLLQGKIHLQEWLDGFIHLIAFRSIHKFIPTWTPELTYSAISILCGGIYVFLALKLSSLLGKSPFGKVLIFFFLISSGSVQLFFGYVESYTILQVVLLAYVLLAARYLSGRSSILPVLLILLISVSLHVTSLIFAPSFAYLLMTRDRGRSIGERPAAKTISNPFVVGALIVASCLVISWVFVVAIGLKEIGKGIFILPLQASEAYPFGMFSLAHISEFANQLLLLSPMGMSLLIFFLFFKIRFREFEDRLTNFLILCTSFALLYLFVVNFTLGSADWDLRSSPAPFLALLGVLLFLGWGEKSNKEHLESEGNFVVAPLGRRRFKAWGLVFIWFGLFHVVPWILINAHHQRSVDRYVLIQENDPHPVDESGYNLYKVARILSWVGLPEEVENLYSRAIAREPNDPANRYNLALYYYRRGELDQALWVLDVLLTMHPAYPKANCLIGKIYLLKKDPAKALTYLERASPYLADNPDGLYHLGSAYYLTGQFQKAEACALQIIEMAPARLKGYRLLGKACGRLGDFDRARQAWEHILSIRPGDAIALRNLKELKELKEFRPK